MKNLLQQKLELEKLPFFSKGNLKGKDLKDHAKYLSIEKEISKTWLKFPDWINFKGSPYVPSAHLPAKGTVLLFIECDKIKDKKEFFGFRLDNYRIEEGTFYGLKIVKDNGSDRCRPALYVKVLKDGYIHFKNADEVIVKPKR